MKVCAIQHLVQSASAELVCRAQMKMRQILSLSLIPLASDWNVLDIGAAPGGWSAEVAAAMTRLCAPGEPSGLVFAIDPAKLAPGLPSHVVHLAKRSEDAMPEVAARVQQVHLVCCDANVPAERCADMALHFQPLLQPGSFLALTFKNFSKSFRCFLKAMETAEARLAAAGFVAVYKGHLLANTETERTYIGQLTDVIAAAPAAENCSHTTKAGSDH